MAGVSQLGYLGIGVSDFGEWEKYIRNILGLEITEDSEPGLMYLRMDDHHHRYMLRQGNDDLDYIGWQVSTPQELNEVAQRLEDNGVSVSAGTREEAAIRRVQEFIKCEDPSGIPTEIFYGPLIEERKLFTPSRPISGFRTGEMGMGHLVVYQRNNEESTRFYRDLLGFKISDLVRTPDGHSIVFMHANPRHHSIAFLETPPMEKRIHHFMLECNNLDDVGQAWDIVQDKNVPIVMRLGRHIADNMVSFYMKNPSGFASEYGWGGLCINDEDQWQVRQYDSGKSIWGHQMPQEWAEGDEVTAKATRQNG